MTTRNDPPRSSAASGIPTLRGQDHVGITVPDLQQAIDYPRGMAYEVEGGPVLWSPKDQAAPHHLRSG